MSVRATSWVWDQPMPPSEKIVLLRLADHANPDGGDVYPSVASVAAHTGISTRQVQRYIKSFVERGILVISGHAKGGRSNPREYQFTFRFTPRKGDSIASPISESKGDADDTVSETVTTEKGDIQRSERVTPSAERVTPMTQKGDTAMSPEPSITTNEPSGEPSLAAQSPSKPSPKPKRATQVPDEFPIDDRWIAWGSENGFTVDDMRSQVPQFQDHYRSKGEPRKDWDATFRTWMRNAKRWGHLTESNVTKFQSRSKKDDGWSPYDIADYAVELERQGL